MVDLTNQERNRILVQMNFPAPPLTDEEVKMILNGNSENAELYWLPWLETFFDLPRASLTETILSRFREVTTQETFMNVGPSIQQLLKPLKESGKSYCLGLYAASIDLSAVTAESLQMLLWEMHKIKIHGIEINDDQEKSLFGKKFEKLEQVRRIVILDIFKWITPEQKNIFQKIREARNCYLHP